MWLMATKLIVWMDTATEVVMLVEEAAAKATLAVASDTLMKSLFGA